MEDFAALLFVAGFVILAAYVGIKNAMDHPRNGFGRRKELFEVPKAAVSGSVEELNSRTFRANRVDLYGKPVVHPLDHQKKYQQTKSLDVRPTQNIPSGVNPNANAGNDSGIAKDSVKAQELTAPENQFSVLEKTLVETTLQLEVDEAEEFWKDPVSVTSRTVGSGQTRAQQKEQLRKNLLPDTPQDLLQGIVLTEILQPPRSKRPHHSVFKERKK